MQVRIQLVMCIHDVANSGGGDLKQVYCCVRDMIGFLLQRAAVQIRSLSECRVVGLIRLALMMQVALEEGPQPHEGQQQSHAGIPARGGGGGADAAAGWVESTLAAEAVHVDALPAADAPVSTTSTASTAAVAAVAVTNQFVDAATRGCCCAAAVEPEGAKLEM